MLRKTRTHLTYHFLPRPYPLLPLPSTLHCWTHFSNNPIFPSSVFKYSTSKSPKVTECVRQRGQWRGLYQLGRNSRFIPVAVAQAKRRTFHVTNQTWWVKFMKDSTPGYDNVYLASYGKKWLQLLRFGLIQLISSTSDPTDDLNLI